MNVSKCTPNSLTTPANASLALFIIRAKKFLKDDWLKREVFQPNVKPICVHVDISFPWQPTWSCMAERFPE